MVFDKEPIIYKEGIYIGAKDLGKILEGNFKLIYHEKGIDFKYGESDKAIEAFLPIDEKKIKTTNSKKSYIGAYGFSALIIALVLFSLKDKKGSREI